jgi:hypothetical protein
VKPQEVKGAAPGSGPVPTTPPPKKPRSRRVTADKHPVSVGQPTEHTLCWRVHRDGYVCIRDEGHPDEHAVTADAAHVAAVAEATRWENHGVRYADDDAMQCMCGWDANGEPDRLDLYRLHIATVAVETLTPLIRAQVAAEIRAEAGRLTRDGATGTDRVVLTLWAAARIAEATP